MADQPTTPIQQQSQQVPQAPQTLPPDFDFNQPQNTGASQQNAPQTAPQTLPADFFQSSQSQTSNQTQNTNTQLTPEQIRNNSYSLITDIPSGIAKGAGQTVNTVSKLLNKIPVVGEYLAPSQGVRAASQITQGNSTGEHIGTGIEGIAEFFLGDEALKGLSIADKLGLATKVAKVAESHPLVGKLITTGLNALRSGTVGTSQALAHGETPTQSAESGALAGGTGGLLEGASNVVQELAPTVKTIAGEAIPVRASENSKVATIAENAAPSKGLEKFNVEQTQPAAKRVIGNVATDIKNVANEKMAPVDASSAIQKLRDASQKAVDLQDAATQIRSKAKVVFDKLDQLTKNDADLQNLRNKLTGENTTEPLVFSDLQKMESAAYRRGDYEAVKAARSQQEALVNNYANEFNPNDLKNARANWKQANALQDVHDALNTKSVLQPTPIRFRPTGTADPQVINGKNFTKEILNLKNNGSLQQAGLSGQHIQDLQDLGTLLENAGNVHKLNNLVKGGGAALETLGVIHNPAVALSTAKVAVPAWTASQILGQVMTNQKVASGLVKLLQAGAKVGPAVAAQKVFDGTKSALAGK